LVEANSATSKAQQAQDHGEPAGDDRRRRPTQRHRHRLVPVGVAAQLLAVAGGQQQGVVGPGAEHQHRQDERALAVDGQAGVLGEQVDRRLGGGEGDEHAGQRQHPQGGAAVGKQQDDDHDHSGDVQQRGVEAGEHVGEVGEVPARPGRVRVQVTGVRVGDRAHLLDPGGELLPAVALRVDLHGHDHLQRPAVLGGDRAEDLAGDVLDAGEPLHVGGDLGAVGCGHLAAGALVDHQDREDVARRELLGQVDDLRGLGVVRQPGGGVVLLGAVELAGQRPRQREHHHPEDEDQPLGPASRRQAGHSSRCAHAARKVGCVVAAGNPAPGSLPRITGDSRR
jgi:hypothetical protein